MKTCWVVCKNDYPMYYTFDRNEAALYIDKKRDDRDESSGHRIYWHFEAAYPLSSCDSFKRMVRNDIEK